MQGGAISGRLPVDEFKHFMSSIHPLVWSHLYWYTFFIFPTSYLSSLSSQNKVLLMVWSSVKIPHDDELFRMLLLLTESMLWAETAVLTALWACRWAFLTDDINVSSQTRLDRPENWRSDVGNKPGDQTLFFKWNQRISQIKCLRGERWSRVMIPVCVCTKCNL